MTNRPIGLIHRRAIDGPGTAVEGVRVGQLTIERVWTHHLGDPVPFGWIAQWRSRSFLLRTARSR